MNENKLTKQNLRALVVMAGLQIAKFETALIFKSFKSYFDIDLKEILIPKKA